MSKIQEFTVWEPDMMHDYFGYGHHAGENHQEWRAGLLQGDKVELWFEGEHLGNKNFQGWLAVEVGAWNIEDGSGNAPGANAHFFWIWHNEGKRYKIDFAYPDKIRVEAPTISELEQKGKLCEGLHCIEEETRWNPARYGQCYQPVTMKVHGSWYCDEHGKTYTTSIS